MSLGLQETRMRRKRQRRWAMIKWLLILAALGAAFYFAYETARQLARIEVERLEDRVVTLENRLQESAEEKRALRNELEATQEKLAQWRQRYEEEVPEGEPAELLEAVRVFDVYTGAGVPEGTRSIAYRLVFRHTERTLKDAEVDDAVERVLARLRESHGVERRG